MLFYLDQVIATLVGIVFPLYGFPSWRRLRNDIAFGRAGARRKLYIRTMCVEWILTLLVLLAWSMKKRALSDLGLVFRSSANSYVVLGIAIVASALLFRQLLQTLARKGNFPDEWKAQIRPYAGIIPETAVEHRWFILLNLTAAVSEELLYRGFLFWYLSLHVHELIAAGISLILFTVGHGLQSLTSVKKTFFGGAVLTALYLVSGSLLPSMLLHFSINFTTGLIGSEILKFSEENV